VKEELLRCDESTGLDLKKIKTQSKHMVQKLKKECGTFESQ